MEIGRLTAIFDSDVRKFDVGVSHVKKEIGGITTGLEKATGSVSSFTSSLNPANMGLTGLGSKFGLVAGGAVLFSSALGGVATGIFKLAQDTATAHGGLQDLNDQTGIGVGNLSALKVAFDSTGGSIDSGATALTRYLKNVSDVNSGNDKLRQKFLDVGFTVNDLNAAYGNSDKAVEILVKRVGEYSNSQDRLNALQKLGVRNGAELNAAIVEMDGNLAAFRAEAERLGLVVTPEQAKAADDFDDSLQLLEKQIKGMTYGIAHQYLPQISGAIHDVSDALSGNQKLWADWGGFIRTEIRGIRVAASGLFAFIANANLGVGTAAMMGISAIRSKNKQLHGEEFLSENVGGSASINNARTRRMGGLLDDEDKKGGGGRAKAQRDELAQYKQILERTSQSLAFYGLNTERAKVEQDFLRAGIEALTPSLKIQAQQYQRTALAVADSIDAKNLLRDAEAKEKAEAERLALVMQDVTESIFRQGQEISDLMSGYPAWLTATNDFVVAKAKEGYIWSESTRLIHLNNEARKEQLRVLAESATRLRSVFPTASTGLEGRPRIATTAEREAREVERLNELADETRREMRELAEDISGIMQSGFERGWEGLLESGRRTLSQLSAELLQSGILKLLDPNADVSSKAGGIVGGLANKILDAIGLTGGKGGAGDPVMQNSIATDANTQAIQNLTAALQGSGLGGGGDLFGLPSLSSAFGGNTIDLGGGSTYTPGGTGATRERTVTPRDVDGQTRSLNSATGLQTQSLLNQIQLTGQQIIQGLMPTPQSFGAGLLNAVIGGALSGLTSGLASGLTGRGGGRGGAANNEAGGTYRGTGMDTGSPRIVPYVPQRRAGGGPVSALTPYMVGEREPELFVPQSAGRIYNQQQISNLNKPSVTNVYNINVAAPAHSYRTPESQKQLGHKLLALIRNSQR